METTYTCPICGKECSTLASYSEHIAAHVKLNKETELANARKEVEDAHAILLEAAEKYNSLSTTDQVQVNILWNTLRKSNLDIDLGGLRGLDIFAGLDSLNEKCDCKTKTSDKCDCKGTPSFEDFLKKNLNIGDAAKKSDRAKAVQNKYGDEIRALFKEVFGI